MIPAPREPSVSNLRQRFVMFSPIVNSGGRYANNGEGWCDFVPLGSYEKGTKYIQDQLASFRVYMRARPGILSGWLIAEGPFVDKPSGYPIQPGSRVFRIRAVDRTDSNRFTQLLCQSVA